ncbi:glycosyltransferase [Bradyrhizobium diazoefficiens]|nr:glycosyltransferase [Bradyrhizobium diazoefficiens]UCF51483.1 MAG: glycosyltransferase [Bradyrhizobium sp.]MBR0962888.1 glycosyltransferase [Bradyrhizobium diazoefficiens]MBR0977048.1 glycosyltransferase [Bradyrhizobium diazoefficiens]MBR1005693.1 glycosyltransferase [Bradyrhizobium diazoefficiens]MBR1012166.1 glycosyltransferase [Bradyrhizobium diazoefficiens]
MEDAFVSLIEAAPAPDACCEGRVVLVIGNLSPGGAERQAPGRIGVIPNGVDFGSQTGLSPAAIAKAREDFGIPQDAFVVGGVFRLVEQKRPMLWLDAAVRIAAAIPEARFLIYGQGSFLPAMQERIRAPDLANRVTLAGVTDRPLEAMSLFDIFLLTSRGEGLPNVLLEAQSVGTPVVATRAGGAPEAIADGLTGWVIDEPSAEAIAAKIVDLKRRPDRLQAAADAAPAFVKQSFGVTQMIGSTLELYGLDSAPR